MASKKHIISHFDPAVLEMGQALKLAQETGAASEVIESIKKVLELVEQREDFTDRVTTPASEACENIIKATFEHDWQAVFDQGKTIWNLKTSMLSGHLEGQFLKSLVSMQKAKSILDIGMFTGYSALSMAEALPADGELVTVDQEKYLEGYTGSLFKQSPHSNKIKIYIGPATEFMKQRAAEGKTFDMMFLDADKSQYKDYLKVAFEEGLLVPGGTVLIDNAFRRGDGYIPTKGDNPTKMLGESLAANKSLHKVLVPMRDGVLMVRRMEDVEGGISQ